MKKKTVKKLMLAKETVRSLDFSQIEGVAGGVTTTSDLCTQTTPYCSVQNCHSDYC